MHKLRDTTHPRRVVPLGINLLGGDWTMLLDHARIGFGRGTEPVRWFGIDGEAVGYAAAQMRLGAPRQAHDLANSLRQEAETIEMAAQRVSGICRRLADALEA